MAGLVVLGADFQMVQEAPAVPGGAEKMHPGAVGAAGPAGVLPSTATARNRPRASDFAS